MLLILVLPTEHKDGLAEGMVDSYVYSISNHGVNWQHLAEGELYDIKSNPVEQVISLDHPFGAR